MNEKPSCLFPSSGLFAAAELNVQDKQSNQNWLNNESFKRDVNIVNRLNEQEVEIIDLTSHKKRKHKKEKKTKKKRSKSLEHSKSRSKDVRGSRSDLKYERQKSDLRHEKLTRSELRYEELKKSELRHEKLKKSEQLISEQENDLFRIDRKYVKDSLMYDSLYAGDVPCYKISQPRSYGKVKSERYFKVKLTNENSTVLDRSKFEANSDYILLNESKQIEANAKDDEITNESIGYKNPHLQNRTKNYNSYLNQNPSDVDKWIEFVQFQDEKWSEDDARQTNNVFLNEKKLLIVEKALKSNPTNIRLLILRLELLKSTIESDELNEEWKKLTFKYPTNFEIIKNYLKFIVTCSHFSLDNLNKSFNRYMEKILQRQDGHLQSIRDETSDSIGDLERSMLEVILLYTILLKQCGYIERSISIWQALIEFNFYKLDLLTEQTSISDWKEYFEAFWSSGQPRFGEQHSIGWKRVMASEGKNELPGNERINLLNDKENEVVQNENNDKNRIWFEIELVREKFNWQSGKPHEECEDTDHIVLFEEISSCLFRFKDSTTYDYCLLYFLYLLDAIDHQISSNGDALNDKFDLPSFYLENEEHFLNCKNSKLLAPKHFSYDQRIKFTISVFQQSMNLIENRNLDHYHLLVDRYLNYLIQNAKQLDQAQLRKLFKQVLKKPANRDEIKFWQKFAELEVQLNETTSADAIYRHLLTTQLNQQSNQFVKLRLIHDFIEFKLRIRGVKHISLNMTNCLRVDDCRKEREIGVEILLFVYSLINSKSFKSIDELSPSVQLRTKQKINRLYDECLRQVACDEETSDQSEANNLIYLIVLIIYNFYFHKLLDTTVHQRSSIEILEQTSALIDEQLAKVRTINCTSISRYLEKSIYEKHLDLHLLYLKYNYHALKPFNALLNRALDQFPKDRYFLILLVNTAPFGLVSGQIERFTTELSRQIHDTTLEQWLLVIYSEMRRLSNMQQQSVQDFLGNFSTNVQNQQAIDHSGAYSIGLTIRIQNLFERAIQAHNCLLLWRMFLHFEVNQNHLDRAKKVFYRAAEQCPWSKLIYMDAVKIFTMTSVQVENETSLIRNVQDLNDILGWMNERQLRVRTAVEEVEFLIENQHLLDSAHRLK